MPMILIVDDNKQNLYLLEVLLKGNGFDVSTAANGAKALESALSAPPDLIVADILMPVMDGFTLCREWKSNERLKKIPFIFYTATYTDRKNEELALSFGADRFVIKPQEPEVLLQIIRDALAKPQTDAKGFPEDASRGEGKLYRKYSEALFRKLEKKMEDLERANLALTRTIAELQQTQEALRESEKKYRTLITQSPDGIFIVDLQGNFLTVNKAMCEKLQYSEEEFLSMKIWDIVPERYVDLHKKRIGDILRGRATNKAAEYVVRGKDGEMHHIEVLSAPYFIENEVKGFQGIARDITERKQAEEEMATLQVQLQQAQKMEAIGTLAGGIAHDFNNILTGIMGYAELASLDFTDGAKAKSNIQQSILAAQRAKDLVQQILAFSRQGRQERRPLDIRPIIKEGLKFLRATIPATIEIRQNIAGDLGVIEADPTQIHQVLMNLCTNAAHAMSESGGVLEVSLTPFDLGSGIPGAYQGMEPGRFLKLRVSDTGHGIAPATLPRIFEPYFTTKGVGKGTGLGLAVVHGIVKSYGGGITVSSEPGQGTTFEIYFPCIDLMKAPLTAERGEPLLLGKHERILYVDDESTIVDVARIMLKHLGYEVEVRTSSIEARELFRAQPDRFDLVITDMTMPNMTGDKLAQEILSIRPGTPIILCTGFSELMTEEKAKALGIQEFAMKPLAIYDLAKVIRRALDRKKKKQRDETAMKGGEPQGLSRS